MRLKLAAATAFALCLLAACGEKKPETPAAPVVSDEAKLAALPAPYNTANLANGKAQFVKCRSCHSVREADGNLVGPNLHGVFARHPGTAPKFRYTNQFKALPLEKWTPEELDKWLTNPQDYLPGSAMTLDGIKDPDARRDIIAYLMTAS